MPRKSPRQNWSLPLTHSVKIKGIRKTMRTLGDVRALILGLPKEFQDMHTWRHVAAELLSAAKSGDATGATVALEIVLMLNGLLERRAA